MAKDKETKDSKKDVLKKAGEIAKLAGSVNRSKFMGMEAGMLMIGSVSITKTGTESKIEVGLGVRLCKDTCKPCNWQAMWDGFEWRRVSPQIWPEVDFDPLLVDESAGTISLSLEVKTVEKNPDSNENENKTKPEPREVAARLGKIVYRWA